jgi:hypothetical protein
MENITMRKGTMEVFALGNFKLHVYNSNDVMGDTSFIVEGEKALVLMELPLFKENAAEFETYYKKLGKQVAKVVTDYHLGGTEGSKLTMPEGMPGFVKGPVYGGMMQHFAEMFGDTMVALPHGETEEVHFESTQNWAGVSFAFSHGAASDFPGASIIIGSKAYYTHWTPVKMHMSNLQLSSQAAVDAELAEAHKALASGCELFVGGHGGAVRRDGVEFKIAYLTSIKAQKELNTNAKDFETAMKQAWPGLPAEENLQAVAQVLYQK